MGQTSISLLPFHVRATAFSIALPADVTGVAARRRFPDGYIFFIGGHLTNLPLASVLGRVDVMGGHLVNLPLASRHCLADAVPPPNPLMTTHAITAATKRNMVAPIRKARIIVRSVFLAVGRRTCARRVRHELPMARLFSQPGGA